MIFKLVWTNNNIIKIQQNDKSDHALHLLTFHQTFPCLECNNGRVGESISRSYPADRFCSKQATKCCHLQKRIIGEKSMKTEHTNLCDLVRCVVAVAKKCSVKMRAASMETGNCAHLPHRHRLAILILIRQWEINNNIAVDCRFRWRGKSTCTDSCQ